MAKKSHRETRPRQATYSSSLAEVHPEATVGPESSSDGTDAYWGGPETTTAPQVGEEEERKTTYAKGSAELLDKFLQGAIGFTPKTVIIILTILWFGFISWLYLQDNEMDKISSIEGLGWFGIKAGLYTALYLLVSGIIYFLLPRER